MEKRTIEIVASVSAVIPVGNYENFKPLYSVKEIVEVNGDADSLISARTDELRALLKTKLDADYDMLRLEQLKRQREDINFYEIDGEPYVSVTSVISAIEPINYDPIKLAQYASRGSIKHAQIDHFFKTGTWENDVLKIPGTKLDYLTVTQGSLKLKWTDCNFMGFWDKYGKDFLCHKHEQVVYNHEYKYAGTLDLLAEYKGKLTICDYKTASNYDKGKLDKYFRQLAAYAKCVQDLFEVEQLMVIPLNPSNKTGYGQPIIETDIDRYFTAFLQDRQAFKKLYQI